MALPKVEVFGKDIYDLGLVTNIPGIGEQKTFQKDKLITNSFNITARNHEEFFSIGNPASLFNGADWLYTPVKVTGREGEVIWNGVLTNILRNHESKTAELVTKNGLYKLRNERINYSSSTWETGATAFRNIADAIGFTEYNERSVRASDNQLLEAGALMKVNVSIDDNISFQGITEKLAEYSNADAYSHDNEIHFQHWVRFNEPGAVKVKTADLKAFPSVTELEREILNDYSIGYDGDGGVPATDAANGNIGVASRTKFGVKSVPELRSGSTDNMIAFKDLTTAVYVGEGYMRRTSKNIETNPLPLTQISFELFSTNREWLTLNSYFKLTFPDEGWTEKIFEVFQFTIDEDNDSIPIVAVEVIT